MVFESLGIMSNNKPDEDKTEPKENDKWMDNNEKDSADLTAKSSRLDELRGRAKRFASNKFHLIIVLLCLMLFIIFLIVIILAVQLGTYRCPVRDECRTAECLRSAASVVARSDPSADPCDDFWSYSCRGWIDGHPVAKNRGSFSVSDLARQQINERLRHVIDLVAAPYDADPSSHRWKVKNFYSVCMSVKDIEFWVPEKIKQAIHQIGGWALIKDSPGGAWSRNDVLKKLQVTFGVRAFFRLLVEPDDADPVRNVIKLVPDGLGLPSPRYYFKPHDDLYVKAYKDFIKNTMQQMDVTLHEANRFAEEIFHYEKRIAEITPNTEDLRNTKDLYQVMTVNELDRLSTSILWTDILQAYFPGIIHPETQIAVLSEEYFKAVSRIISSTDNSVLNNYYMWRFIHTYAPFSSSKFRLILNHYKQTLEGVSNLNLHYEDRWESCIEITGQYLGHALGAMYIEKYFPQESLDQVQVYLHKLAGALSAISNDIPWLRDEETRDSAQSKIRSLLLLIGHPNFVKNHTLDTYYKELRVQTDYFQNIKEGVYFLHKKQEEMLKKNALPDYSWTLYPHDVFAEYKYSGNQLVGPAGVFESPLFEFDSSLAVKYGILAGHVANQLSKTFDDKGINYDIYGTLKLWMSNQSMQSFKQREECLKRVSSNYSLHGVTVLPDLTIGSHIADIGGVKIAYEAYKRHTKDMNEGVLPGIDANNDQLFFISYAQSLCQNIRPEKLRAIREESTTLPAELRVLASLQQLPEFSSVFSCPRGSSKMNSIERCYMW